MDHPTAMDRFMLAYFAWAQRHFYPRLPPRWARAVEEMDRRFIEKRRITGTMGAIMAAASATAGFSVGLHAAGVSWPVAVLMGAGFAVAMVAAMLSAWVQPELYTLKRVWRLALLMMLGTYAGALGSLLQTARGATGSGFFDTMVNALWRATPFQLIAGLMLLMMMWVASATRRTRLQAELEFARVAQERDAAHLRLLQAQIQPHFLFNTLAALQHWVDTHDERAPALLRSLTGFLRASTAMFARDSVPLAEEADMARHYLAIMQARLGDRLRRSMTIAPGCEQQALPPGLLLTLVENAVGHGIESSLAGGEIRITARREGSVFELVVEDDGAGLATHWAEGVGLANSRERLRHAFGPGAQLQLAPRAGATGTVATVRIP